MRNRSRAVVLGVLLIFAVTPARAQVTMAPLNTFGTSGWLAPGSSAFNTTGGTERGLAYSATSNHLYLVSRAGGTNVRILDSATGADLGGLATTGISGGTFAVNAAATSGDGAIYVGNLTANNNTSAFILYKWANEAAAPVAAVNTTTLATGARVGDDLAAIGSGSNTLVAAGYSGVVGFAVLDPTAGTATNVGTVTGAVSGDYRIGITLRDSTHLFGSQGSGGIRNTSFSLSGTGNVDSTFVPSSVNQRLLAYAVVGGTPLLAVENSSTTAGDILASTVYLYDVTNPASPVLITSGKNATGTLTAANGNGELAWDITGPNTANLYALNANQGIEAFTVSVGSVPEPTSFALAGMSGLGLVVRRLRRRPA